MQNNGTLIHQHFEELAALAALGEASPQELKELQVHAAGCQSCRAHYRDFEEILNERLPVLDSGKEPILQRLGFLFRGNSYKARFSARAAEHGIAVTMQKPSLSVPLSYALAFGAAGLVLLLTVGIVSYGIRESRLRDAATNLRLQGELAQLRHRVDELSSQTGSQLATVNKRFQPEELPSRSESLRTSDQYAKMQARSRALENELRSALAELEKIRAELGAARSSETSTSERLRESELALGRATDELNKIRQAGSGNSSDASEHARLAELTGRLKVQSEEMEREERLLAADRDIRDLMGARNLHIVDVFDVDGSGNTKRPFGRAFYTEGKSLIFYAFDLGDKKNVQTKSTFQAWGQRESKTESVQSLGIFYMDDQKQNRWVLKFDDPNVLAQIDAVFVTVEPPGGSTRPNGQKLLYAYLNASPNHP